MQLALFDLDNTLVAGDSEQQWLQFLAAQGVIDATQYLARNEDFLADYERGALDIDAYLRFVLRPLAEIPPQRLAELRHGFIDERIRPLVAPGAPRLLDEHRRRGDHLLIITAANRFIASPIAELFEADTLLATEPAMAGDRYTGEVAGTPCFREGKIKRLEDWLGGCTTALGNATFYSDSNNDLPLLERVGWPVAVDPDPILAREVRLRGWPTISLRDPAAAPQASPGRE